MYVDSNHPGLKKYRAARERDKRRAIKRAELRKQNPNLSYNQVEEIVRAEERAEAQSKTIKVGGKSKKDSKHRGKLTKEGKSKQRVKDSAKEVKVEYVPNVRKMLDT